MGDYYLQRLTVTPSTVNSNRKCWEGEQGIWVGLKKSILMSFLKRIRVCVHLYMHVYMGSVYVCARVYAYVGVCVCVCIRVPVCLKLILCSFPMTL